MTAALDRPFRALRPEAAVDHLTPAVWRTVNARLVAKAIGEFAHELLLAPRPAAADGDPPDRFASYELPTDHASVCYRFRARRFALDHWWVDPASIRRHRPSLPDEAPEALTFIGDLTKTLAISDQVLPTYLEEIAGTLSAWAYREAGPAPSAADLVAASFQEVERAMIEGHPMFVANAGRLGFDAHDYRAFAPEASSADVHLVWLAARKDLSEASCSGTVTYDDFLRAHLGEETWARFAATLAASHLDPSAYRYLPVHAWQWANKVAQLFARELACGQLVFMGAEPCRYVPQQSIRTLLAATASRDPGSMANRHYVKTALSIQNLGFTRGMPASVVRNGPAVNEWARALVENDPFLRACGFRVLCEVAFVAFRHPVFERAIRKRSDPRKEMLGALWRESPLGRIAPGQKLVTMAAFLHCDKDGVAYVKELIAAAGCSAEDWVRAYLRVYLVPLVHCFYRYHLVFTPHGENLIMVLERGLPVGVFIKDLAEDIGVVNPLSPLPEEVKMLALRVPTEVMTLSIFTDCFDCVFRVLAPLLDAQGVLCADVFWRLVGEAIDRYQCVHPELAAAFARDDLFAPTFLRNCLNRLQLKSNREMIDLNAADPVTSLQMVGELQNPIARSEHTR
jgi:siderophore synthetase component